MHLHQRVVVDVHDLGFRGQPLRHLMGVVRRGQPGADVEELADPGLLGQEGHRSAQEPPVFHCGDTDGREPCGDRISGFPVGGEVIFAAQPIVVPAGRVRHRRVDMRRQPVLVTRCGFVAVIAQRASIRSTATQG